MKISIEVRGDRSTVVQLRRFAENASDARPFFRHVGELLLEQSRRQWRSQSGWAPLDRDTIRRKLREGQSPRILRATGALERALTFWGAAGQKDVIRSNELVFGIDPLGPVSYGIYHQEGRGVPRRPILPETRLLRPRIREALYDHLFGR